MRKLLLTLTLVLAGCPDGDAPAKGPSEKGASERSENEASTAEPDPDPDTWSLGLRSETAFYKEGGDGGPDKLRLGGVAGRASSPDGKQEADLMRVIESDLFPEAVARPPQLSGPDAPPRPAVRAWVVRVVGDPVEVALSNPVYSAGARTLEFDVEVLDGTMHEGSLGPTELRVQDCPDTTYVCAKSTLTACDETIGPVGTCWNWVAFNCLPCHCSEDMRKCVERNPECCGKPDEPCYPSRLGPHGWERYCL